MGIELNWEPDNPRYTHESESLIQQLYLGSVWRGRQRMRWLDSITDLIDMNLTELWEIVKDRGAWQATVHRAAKSQTWLSDWTTMACEKKMQSFSRIFGFVAESQLGQTSETLLLGCPFYWHIVACCHLLWFFLFLWYQL